MTAPARPVLAVPASRGRAREIALHGTPAAVGTTIVIGWDANHREITLNLAGARREWLSDLINAALDARRVVSPEVTP